MTWSEIKHAVEEAGVQDDEEIGTIQCENLHGDHTFNRVRLGRKVILKENISVYEAQREADGCAV